MIRIKSCFLFLLVFCFCQKNLLAQNSNRAIDSLLNVLKTVKEDTSKVNILNDLGLRFRNSSNYEKAKQYADSALTLADKLNFKKGRARVYYDIGRIYTLKGNYPEALKNNLVSLKIYEELGDKKGISSSYNNIGIIYDYQGNYPLALKNYLASLKLMEEVGDKQGIAAACNNIGIIYFYQGNYPEALKNYQASLKINEEIGNKDGIASVYTSIGVVCHYQKNYSDALKNFFISLKIAEEIGDKPLVSLDYYNISDTYLAQKDYQEALVSLSTSIKIAEEIGDNGILASALIKKGEVLSRLAAVEKDPDAKTKYTEALLYLNKGLLLAKEVGAKEDIKEAYNYMAETHKEMKDYKKALQYNNLYVELKDSLVNNETTRKLEQQRTQYEVEKSVEEEKIKNEEALAEQKADHKRKNELLLTGLVILGIISFFVALLVRQRNLKRRAIERAETGHKMAELELQSLRAQLNPHFMFNSLNAIQDLILKEDNDRSHLYLSRFSKLLRMLLDNANQPFVSVKQEIEFLELYLSLENLRIPDLQFSIEKDPKINTEERMIPNMMLQPYIENAIWHGLSNKKGNRKLQVRIHENGSATEFEIEDNGVGRKKAAELKSLYRKGHTSKGMELLSKRFSLLSKEYGAAIQTTIIDLGNNGDATGTLVKIDVPFSLSEQANQIIHDTNHNN